MAIFTIYHVTERGGFFLRCGCVIFRNYTKFSEISVIFRNYTKLRTNILNDFTTEQKEIWGT